MDREVGISLSPPLAQSTTHQRFRRLLGRSTAPRGRFALLEEGRPIWWKADGPWLNESP